MTHNNNKKQKRKNIKKPTHRDMYQCFQKLDTYLVILELGSDITWIIAFCERFSLQMNLYIRFLSRASKELSLDWQKRSLALVHLGFLRRILRQSL